VDTEDQLELLTYFYDGLGSGSRLDYGTGHELSFLAFLYVAQKLNFWDASSPEDESFVILVILRAYLNLTRLLQQTYRLEPAGSHGVWGLDDHHFLPYVFGASQLIGTALALL